MESEFIYIPFLQTIAKWRSRTHIFVWDTLLIISLVYKLLHSLYKHEQLSYFQK